jgi:hypothetical protein
MLARSVEQLAGTDQHVQKLLTAEVEARRHEQLEVAFVALPVSDRRRVAFNNVNRYSMQRVGSWPDHDSAYCNMEREIGTARCFARPLCPVSRSVRRSAHRQHQVQPRRVG